MMTGWGREMGGFRIWVYVRRISGEALSAERRLAPDSRKIELGEDATTHLKDYLLQAMAFDLASIHAAGSTGADALRHDLKKRPRDWLFNAAKIASDSVRKDYEEWRRDGPAK